MLAHAHEPGSVLCPWCAKYFAARPERGQCDNCGGVLPAPAGLDRGPAPPTAPRTLPAAFVRAVKLGRNVLAILGLVFSSVGAPFLVAAAGVLVAGGPWVVALVFGVIGPLFLGLGLALLAAGRSSARRRLGALERGIPAEGEIVSNQPDPSISINGRHPWLLVYAFSAAGRRVEGRTRSFSAVDGERKAGDPVWVVHLPDDADVNTLWPPLA